MSQEIEDRDDAVEYLQRKGFHAFKRDWIMGETVGVAAGLQPENNSGIKCWDHCITFISAEISGQYLIVQTNFAKRQHSKIYKWQPLVQYSS